MPSALEVSNAPGISKNRRLFGRQLDWLLSSEHIHFKLLFGNIVGLLVIAVLGISFVIVTLQSQGREKLRAHTIEVMRLSSVLENDISTLENAFRGHLLTNNNAYLENLARLRALFEKHSGDLANVLAKDKEQQLLVLQIRDNIQKLLITKSLSRFQTGASPDREGKEPFLDAPQLTDAVQVLETIQRNKQIELDHRVRDQEWAVQSTQVLNFVARMERAACDMEKGQHGFLLTGEPALIDSYKRAATDFDNFHGYLSVLLANDPTPAAQLKKIGELVANWTSKYALPSIEEKRSGESLSAPAFSGESETAINSLRRAIEDFEKEQFEIYQQRSNAAARERILIAAATDVFCVLAGLLLIGSGCYSFVLYRRQLKKLEQADMRIHSVVDQVLDGMILIDEKGLISSMNPAARRMFGFNGSHMTDHRFASLIPKYFENETSHNPIACTWSALLKRTGAITLAQARNRTQATFPVELSLTKVAMAREKFYVAMVRDITERKRFEKELAAEKNSLAVTLGSIGDGVITTDATGRILICNKAAEAMTGWPAAEAVGQSLRNVFTIFTETETIKGNGAGYRSEAEAILRTTPERATLTSRDGVERVIEQVASPIRDAKNEICGVVLVFRDMTERQRDEAERRKAEALDQLGLLAGGIAHDFNNLLTAIIGNVSLAAMLLPPDDDMAQRLADAKNASLRARDLAQQLLTFARGGAPIKQTASIADLVGETVSFTLRGSHSRSELKIEPDLWTAEFDPGQISQVIANLVVNADQAMPEGGTIHVTCDNFSYSPATMALVPDLAPGDYIRIQVRDEGTGIPESCLKRIFDPYFTTKAKGSGLGLATTYSVIKNHNGLITVDSQLHCGSTFTVYLPAAHRKATAPEPAALTNKPVRGSGCVLVVDDEEAIRLLVEFTLTSLGYEVTAAESALKGIEFYRQALERDQRFDLVILDLTLPGGMGGKEALKRLIELDPMVNAVVSSGYAMDATMSRYQDFGFRGMIAKPYEAAELGRKVHELIEANRNGVRDYELQHAC
jgi:PAS domain S-box-containing protein